MRANKSLLTAAAVLIVCVVAVWFCTSIQGGEKTYEIQPQIRIPEYRTDAARAIDAYERLMDRYMGMTEKNLIGINSQFRIVSRQLDSIDAKLAELSARMTKIEKALRPKQPKPLAGAKPRQGTTDKQPLGKSSPAAE